jgi:putative NADH-flavin reductase
MNLVVFGATSKTGQHVVERALDAGHQVRAFARTPAKMELRHARLEVVEGDALHPDDVERAVAGQDAVISLIGPTETSPKFVASRSTEHILSAMRDHGVQRLVVASVAGIPVGEEGRGLGARLITGLLKLILGDMFTDRRRQLELLQQSDRAWTALRLPRLTDAPPTGDYELGITGFSPTMSITRADLAQAMLDQLDDDTYLRQAPKISNSKVQRT